MYHHDIIFRIVIRLWKLSKQHKLIVGGRCRVDVGETSKPSWVGQKLASIRVTKRHRAPFLIDAYKDKIYYGMIDGLGVCPMLSGRLWKFDVGIKYDERDKIYQLVKDGAKHRLTSLHKST